MKRNGVSSYMAEPRAKQYSHFYTPDIQGQHRIQRHMNYNIIVIGKIHRATNSWLIPLMNAD